MLLSIIKHLEPFLDIETRINFNRTMNPEHRVTNRLTKEKIYGHEKYVVVGLFRTKMERFEEAHTNKRSTLIAEIFISLLNPRHKLLYLSNKTLCGTVLERARAFKSAAHLMQEEQINIKHARELAYKARHLIKVVKADLKNKLFGKERDLFAKAEMMLINSIYQ